MFGRKRPDTVWLVLAALFALVPVISWLQYQWIAEWSEAEAERLRVRFRQAAVRFGNDFNAPLAQYFVSVQAPLPDLAPLGRDDYASRFATWRALAPPLSPEPVQMIKAFYISEGGRHGTNELLQLDTTGLSFAPASWTEELSAVRAALEERRGGRLPLTCLPGDVPVLVAPREGLRARSGSGGGLRRGPPLPGEILEHGPWAGVWGEREGQVPGREGARRGRFGTRGPRWDLDGGPEREPMAAGIEPSLRGPRAPQSSAATRHPGWSIAVLDRDYILQRLIPALLESSFGSAGAGEYEAIVVSNVTGMVWHATPGADSEHGFEHPDATVPLLTLALEGARRVAVPRHPDSPPGAAVHAPWVLKVRSQFGSLEQAVAATRTRQLAISGALMLMMATALVVLWISVRRARELSQRQLEFVASVSHELRTPLAVIRSAGENLADGIVSNGESVQRYGTLVRDEGRRLSGMVEQTLRFAGTPSGRAKYNMQETKVAAVVESAVESQRHTIEASGCRLDVQVDAGLPLILADAAALSHAVGNLIANAAKHGSRGGWIGVRASRLRDAQVSIEVSDQGPGIPPQEVRHIFEPFYRGRQATDSQVPGTGLGLALVKWITEAHEGRVSVRARSGEGTRFTLSLPAASELKAEGADEQTHSDRRG